MRMRWKLVLPVVGFILFVGVTYQSQKSHDVVSRYFWWSSIPLDSEPLNKSRSACKHGIENCPVWGPEEIYVTTGLLPRVLMLSATPAFFLGSLVIEEFARRGISEVPTFMVSMPLLIAGWFYLLGSFIDKLVSKMRRPKIERSANGC
jgi:hypothetical protein